MDQDRKKKLSREMTSVRFRKVSNVLKKTIGYDKEDVDTYLRELRTKVEELEGVVDDYKSQLDVVLEEVKSVNKGTEDGEKEGIDEILERLDAYEETQRTMLYKANEEATRIIKKAKKDAESIEIEANENALNIRREAEMVHEEKMLAIESMNKKKEEILRRMMDIKEMIEREAAL